MDGKKEILLNWLINALFDFLSPELLCEMITKTLNDLEQKVLDTENELDDKVIIPLIELIRSVMKND